HPLEALALSFTRHTESVTATATLMDDLARDPRALRLYVHKLTLNERHHILLVIDQFEELFTLCGDEFERQAFIDNLLAVFPSGNGQSGEVILVIALRADFYAHLAQYEELRDAVAAQQEYIGPMTTDELRRAMEEPAHRGNWEFEPGLVDLILRDVGDEPGALPLLSHALLETWKRRSGRTLTLKGYADSGGVRGAIAQTAETVYAQLTSEQQAIAHNIFLRLTELGEGTEDTRRRAAFAELIPQAQDAENVRAVLNTLAEARLVTLGEGTAEVAHEALIREWATLHEWLTQDREGLRLHRHLTQAAQEWELLERDSGALYRGARLAQAREWASTNTERLNELERTFLQASLEQEQHDEQEREAQRQRELEAAQKLAEEQKQRAEEQSRAAHQLRWRAIHLTVAFVLALVLALIALFFGDQANQSASTAQANARAAEQQRLIATSRELSAASLNNLNVDPELSILLASRAVSLTYSIDRTVLPEALDAMHRAVQSSRTQLVLTGHTDEVNGVAFSPDGTRIATASDDNTAKVWDAATGKELLTLVGHTQFAGDTKFDARGKRKGVEYVVFSPDGTHIATAGGDNTARIWDAATGKELFTLVGHTQLVQTVRYSPDGKYLATASADSTAKIWDAASGQLLLTLSGHTNAVKDVAFSPDGTRLATASRDQTVRVWDIAAALSTGATTAKQVLIIPDPAAIGAINGVTFSPDGKHIATAVTAQAKIWDATTGKELLDLPGQLNFVVQVAFSPDGTRLATASYSGQATVYDATTGNELMVLRGSTWINDVAFSPDGKRLVAATLDKTARVWNIGPTQELLTIVDPTGNINSLNYSPDGSRLVTADQYNVAIVWDAATGKHLLTLSGHTDRLYGAVFSPDGTRVATASNDNTAKIWDATTGKELLTLAGHGKKLTEGPYNGLKDIAFSPDGKRVVTGAVDGAAKVWDASTGKELLSIPADSVRVNTVAFSPDGSLIATGGSDNTAKLWEAATGKLLHTFSGHTTIVYSVAFSPDGKHLATSSCDATVKVWDVQTGKILLTLTGFTGCITKLAYSSDGRWLASTGSDQTARVWDATTGKELVSLTGHTAGVSGAVFSPDGTKLATSSNDATVRIYLLRIEDLIALANARLTRTWTLPECVRYLHMEQCPEQP
ncbi:MAG: PQQ-binding-like beta-propeller repeat protein, partial [Chloroflexota bacterium]|nr:PQQ-binding-like beta-propeller repeat protein [Chloroflexota bacterium]